MRQDLTYATAAEHLHIPGTVGVIATDTVYGVVARAADKAAVSRLYRLKLPERTPGTLVAASIDQLVDLGIKRRYITAVEQFWPGAVSIVVPSDPDLTYVDQGAGSIAVRIPDYAPLRQLLEVTGPLLTISAHPPGKLLANTVAEAEVYFNDAVDFYEDGGDLSGNQPSTVIRVIDDAIEILHQGAVKVAF